MKYAVGYIFIVLMTASLFSYADESCPEHNERKGQAIKAGLMWPITGIMAVGMKISGNKFCELTLHNGREK